MSECFFRLCCYDAHQLFQRLEAQVKKYMGEVKEQLLKQLSEGHNTPSQARQFMSLLLEEHDNFRTAVNTIGSFIQQLVCVFDFICFKYTGNLFVNF